MKKPNIHTVYNPDSKRWENKEAKNPDPISTHKNKELAVEKGDKLATEAKVEQIIHKKDGTIQNPNSHGNDPNPPKDKVR